MHLPIAEPPPRALRIAADTEKIDMADQGSEGTPGASEPVPPASEAAEAAAAAKASNPNRAKHIATGAAIGIGSAALVAALLYANRTKKGGKRDD
jgi:hypothetical protein